MNIFKRAYNFCKNKIQRFISKKLNRKVYSKIRKATQTIKPETEILLNDLLKKEEAETIPVINEIAETTTISELAELTASQDLQVKQRRPVLELHELEAELNNLNKKYFSLEVKQRRIQPLKPLLSDFISEQVVRLNQILNNNTDKGKIQLSKISISGFDKSYNELEKLLSENSTLITYQKREAEKKNQEELYRKQLKSRLGELESLIGQNKLQEAKTKISSLEKSLSQSSFEKEKERLQKAKSKLRQKELANLQKVQDELLKRQKEEAEKLRLIEIEKQKQEEIARQYDFITDETKDNVLNDYHIQYLFHMTEISNLSNIFEHGLLSHNEAHSKGLNQVDIALQDVNQRRASKRPIYGISLHDFVPMYFNPKNPMLYKRSEKQNQIVILAIDRRAIYQDKSMFTDGNAASGPTNFYNELKNLEKLNWACIRDDYWSGYHDGKRVKCAETLTYPKVTLKHIQKIYCNNMQTKSLVDSRSPKDKGFKVELSSKYFFNSNLNYELDF